MANQTGRAEGRLTPSQARAARRARRNRRRRIVRIASLSAIGLIAAIFILSLFAGGLVNVFSPSRGPDGPGIRIEDQGRTHIFVGESHPPYNSVPATSGWHYDRPDAPARWGIYDTPISDEVLVHNLEHGGVGILYDCPGGCTDLVDQLAGIVNGAQKVIMAPYPDMDSTIALTTWTFIDQFDTFDRERIEAFIFAHLESPNAPERFAP